MIVATRPRFVAMVREVWLTLTLLLLWDVAVVLFYDLAPFKAPALPLALFGAALALFLGVRDSAAYARWWEGRGLWGAMINASRSLAREAAAFLPDTPEAQAIRRRLVRRHIAYVYALKALLRIHPPEPEARAYLPQGEAEAAFARANPPNAMLDAASRDIAAAQRAGMLDTIQQTQVEHVLVDVANAQGGMERLKRTPLPNQYRFFPELFTRVFCALLPIGLVDTLGWTTPIGSTVAALMFLAMLRIADDLTDPFANSRHDVPLSAMCRTIEIDLLQGLGETAPEPIKPVDGVLW